MGVRDSKETWRKYQREYQLRRYHCRRARVIELLGGKCVRCGSDKDLQIDHRDPSLKTMQIAKVLKHVSEKSLLKELRVCQLLCEPCHIKKTVENGENRRQRC